MAQVFPVTRSFFIMKVVFACLFALAAAVEEIKSVSILTDQEVAEQHYGRYSGGLGGHRSGHNGHRGGYRGYSHGYGGHRGGHGSWGRKRRSLYDLKMAAQHREGYLGSRGGNRGYYGYHMYPKGYYTPLEEDYLEQYRKYKVPNGWRRI